MTMAAHLCRKILFTRSPLPIKTRALFQCVRWNSLILSPFKKQDQPLLVKIKVEEFWDKKLDARSTLDISTYNSQGTLVNELRFKTVPAFIRPIQPVQGLLCFAGGRYKDEIVICNPSTGELETPPPPPPPPPPKYKDVHRINNACVGFGHVASTDEFKVVRFIDQYNWQRKAEELRCQVLTLGTTTGCSGWRELATAPPYQPGSPLSFLHGALHLLPESYRYQLPRDTPIVAFDLDTEEYREVKLPQHYYQKTQCKHREHRERLTELQGSLCFVELVRGHIGLWLLKDYHDSRTWVREYNMDTFLLGLPPTRRGICSWRAWPCLIMDDGRLLMAVQHYYGAHEFWCYDPRDNTFSVPEIGTGTWSMTVYQERFLPPLEQMCAVREAK